MQSIRHTAPHASPGDLMSAESVSVDDLERIYRADFPRMVRAARAIVNDAQLGYDAVQGGFVKALAKRQTFRGTSALSTWVWAIVINEARSMVRTARATQTVGLDERDASVGADEGDLSAGDLRRQLARLPERQRMVLFLRYYADMSNTEIATVLGIRSGTVGALLFQGKNALRTILDEVVRP